MLDKIKIIYWKSNEKYIKSQKWLDFAILFGKGILSSMNYVNENLKQNEDSLKLSKNL